MGTTITTAELVDGLDEELLESLWIEDVFGEQPLDLLAEDWARLQHSVEEIYERQVLAGVAVAPVVQLPVPANQIYERSLRGAA